MKKGFTLIELLLVIGIIAILAAIVIVAINPTRQLGQARDTQRANSVRTILNAATQYYVDNQVRPGCTEAVQTAAADVDDCETTSGETLADALDAYIPGDSLPLEPQADRDQFTIQHKTGGVIEVCAPGAEATPDTITSGTPDPICNSL